MYVCLGPSWGHIALASGKIFLWGGENGVVKGKSSTEEGTNFYIFNRCDFRRIIHVHYRKTSGKFCEETKSTQITIPKRNPVYQ